MLWEKRREWRRIQAYNRQAKRQGGVRIVACFLPIKSPWPGPIEPKPAHGKRAVVEPDRLLSAEEVITRVHEYYRCERSEFIAQQAA